MILLPQIPRYWRHAGLDDLAEFDCFFSAFFSCEKFHMVMLPECGFFLFGFIIAVWFRRGFAEQFEIWFGLIPHPVIFYVFIFLAHGLDLMLGYSVLFCSPPFLFLASSPSGLLYMLSRH